MRNNYKNISIAFEKCAKQSLVMKVRHTNEQTDKIDGNFLSTYNRSSSGNDIFKSAIKDYRWQYMAPTFK